MAAKLLFGGSIFCALMALIGALGTDIYLASTQWVLIGVLLIGWAVFLLLEANFRLK